MRSCLKRSLSRSKSFRQGTSPAPFVASSSAEAVDCSPFGGVFLGCKSVGCLPQIGFLLWIFMVFGFFVCKSVFLEGTMKRCRGLCNGFSPFFQQCVLLLSASFLVCFLSVMWWMECEFFKGHKRKIRQKKQLISCCFNFAISRHFQRILL